MKRLLIFWLAVWACVGPVMAAAPAAKKVLVVTTTLGYRHSSIETAERVIAALGRSSGLYEVELASVAPAGASEAVYREQVRATLQATLNRDALKRYHAILFANTVGDLPLPDRDALVQWVRDGGAFIGVHSASDTLHSHRPYIEMLGGEFHTHHEQVTIEALNRDPAHPATRHLPPIWNLDGMKEEIYLFQNYQPDAVHELITLDRHPNTAEVGHFPIAWCREWSKGRVFYTALGHNETVWELPAFQQHLLGGITWALRWPDALPSPQSAQRRLPHHPAGGL
ncbi:MAG: ThuA domain-containing protein [Xanthomonadales bacterium]|nr:ThuA domain-containing protein [Xanthomonadales bacterium]